MELDRELTRLDAQRLGHGQVGEGQGKSQKPGTDEHTAQGHGQPLFGLRNRTAEKP
jgi:hypothetical protein